MGNISTDTWRCEISEDNMEAKVFVNPPEPGSSYTVDDIVGYMRSKGVIAGFVYSEIEKLLQNGMYYRDMILAKGHEAIDGQNGFYDFFFDQGQIKHPTIRSDGSVDYQSMSIIHSVQKGEVLAVYHPAIAGQHGYDVKGREMRCKMGKELPEIRGQGFERSADGLTYTAIVEGRVEYDNYKLFIRDLYEHRGDLNQITGRIDFRGDVVVHGNVCSGTVIRASKSITIDGSVEAATLIAEGDIIIKKGMQGGKRARIVCGGSVMAYFLEYTEVIAKKSIEANIILNCKLSAGTSITVKGKKGTVVGGQNYAVNMISSTNLGNQVQVGTVIATGVDRDTKTRYNLLQSKEEATRKGIEATKREITATSDIRISSESREVREAKANRLRRRLKRDMRLLEHLHEEMSELEEKLELGKTARITVSENVYPGVVVRIDDREMNIKNVTSHVQFYRPSQHDDVEIANL